MVARWLILFKCIHSTFIRNFDFVCEVYLSTILDIHKQHLFVQKHTYTTLFYQKQTLESSLAHLGRFDQLQRKPMLNSRFSNCTEQVHKFIVGLARPDFIFCLLVGTAKNHKCISN